MEAVPDEVVGRRSRPCPSSWSLSPALVSGLLRLDLLGFPKRVDMVPGADDEQPRVDKETTVEISVRVRGPSRRLCRVGFHVRRVVTIHHQKVQKSIHISEEGGRGNAIANI